MAASGAFKRFTEPPGATLAMRIYIAEDAQDSLIPTGDDGKLSTCRRVSSFRHEVDASGDSTGRKLVRPCTKPGL
jgi:hypothetical protein